jgi:uncharacterized membrane protein
MKNKITDFLKKNKMYEGFNLFFAWFAGQALVLDLIGNVGILDILLHMLLAIVCASALALVTKGSEKISKVYNFFANIVKKFRRS